MDPWQSTQSLDGFSLSPLPPQVRLTFLHSLMMHTLQFGTQLSETGSLDETMKSFWKLESFGIPSVDQALYNELCNTIEFWKGKY